MGDTLMLAVTFGAVIVGIWFSYRLFMRGDTNPERVASRLPKGFKADWSWRRGDTYLGYDRAENKLAIVDYPHSAVMDPREVRSVEAEDESVAWIVHRWLVFYVAAPPGKMRVWFGLSSGDRDSVLAKLNSLR
jgi:hypothetical protein